MVCGDCLIAVRLPWKAGRSKVHKVMKEYKEGEQAVAIALSEARKGGAKIPKKKKG